ncbi:MAG: hypothetical protein FWC03_03825 [Treponema sp.]|nr:hypothetical protein [Treponema sp.]
MFHKIRILLIIASFFCVITGGIFAQQVRELRTGTTVNGNLREGEEVWYSVRPTGNGVLIVETLGEKDTYLEAYDSSYNMIIENDDGGENYNARISIMADTSRTYLFKLRYLYNGESGPYSIRANMSSVSELRLDSWVSRNLNGGEEQWFSLRPSGAGLLIVETSGDLDTFLEVYGSSNNLLASDDDSGENYNARLTLLSEAGRTYFIKVRSTGGSGTGPYRVRALMGAISELRMDAWVSRNLGYGDEHWFSIRPSGTGPLLVETSGELHTRLTAYGSSMEYLLENDGSTNSNKAKLEFLGEAGKTYYVKMNSPGSYGGGYNIRAIAGSVSELRMGSWVSGNLQGAEVRWFSVRPSSAGVLIVETSGNADTYLQIYDSSGAYISENDDGGTDYNARLEIFSEVNKSYIVKLSQLGNEPISYRILASFESIPADAGNTTRARAVQIRPTDAVQVFFRSSEESRWFRYDASARTMLTIYTSGNMDTVLVLYDGQGRPIAENDDYNGNNNAYISETLNSGTVYIEVRTFGGQMGRTTLNIEAWQRQ